MVIKGSRFLTKVLVKAKNSGPLHVGNGEGDILLDSFNKPIIPATSISGTFRSFILNHYGTEKTNLIFGSHDSGHSKVYIYDTISDQRKIELRPSLKINGKLGSALKGHKLEREFIGDGHLFYFRFELYSEDLNQKEMFKQYLYHFLKSLADKQVNLGGLKTSGAGYFDILEVTQSDYDLHEISSFRKYLLNENIGLDVTQQVMSTESKINIAEFELQGRLKTPLLIKGNNQNDNSEPDAENIRNINGDFIIPGTSLKGVIRSHSYRILNYLNKTDLIDMIFGKEGNRKEKAAKGMIYTQDVIVKEVKAGNPYHRIRIDKFTGGVMNGALMTEQPIMGDVNMKIHYKCSNDDHRDQAIIGLISMVLRDISLGLLPLGSGNNIGRGRLSCNTMKLNYKGEQFLIDFTDNGGSDIKQVNHFVQELINF